MSHLRLRLCVVFGALLALVATGNALATSNVVISQVYGGGGNSGATLKNDFIELHNRTAAPIDLTGWTVQYGSATGTTWATTPLTGSIAAGGYYLVQEAAGSGGTTNLPAPDATGNIAMSGTAAKVALVSNGTALSGACPSGFLDLVGYGPTANCSETAPTPVTANTTAAVRLNSGCTDTDNNAADFTITTPSPRNSASAPDACGSDSAPSLASSTPAGGATDVATGSSVSLTFSEPVNVTGSWFTIQCVISGGHSATVSGGSTTFTLQPIVAFAQGETCTVTLAGSLITDEDALDPPDAVAGNPFFSFTTAAPLPPGAAIVVSEVYGGGGNTGATLTNDFIELYNRSSTTVNLSGWSVQYASSAGTSWSVTPLTGSIEPGRNYLIQEAAGAGGTTPLPRPDDTGSIAMSGTAGKVALVESTTPLAGACPVGPPVIDFVGYGTAANCSETAPTATLSNTTSAQRKNGGAQDTNNNSVDFTVGAPDPHAGPDKAPTVVSTTPAGNEVGVARDANVTITFSEAVNVAGNWFSISCATSGVHAASVSGGPVTFTFDPAANFAGNESCTVTVIGANVTDTDTDDPPNEMVGNYGFSFQTIDAFNCGEPATLIHDIQGSGSSAVLTGAQTIEGVVVGDYQGTGSFNGYYLQEETGDQDSDPLTSEGIFVFSGSGVDNVSAGDAVRVRGTAGESFSLTQISSVTNVAVCSTGNSLPETGVSLPVANVGDLERYEGMFVRFDQLLTATEVFNLGRFGEVSLSGVGRLYTPTAITTPGAAAIAQLAQNNRSRIILDDGNNQQNIDPTRYPQGGLSASNTLRVGDTLPGLTGVMDFRFSNYRIQPVGPIAFSATNPRTPAPEAVGGNLRIASFNVLNFFNGDGLGGGFPTARGANTQFELDRQRAKEVSALRAMDADIVGFMEIENDSGPNSALAELVGALNAAMGAGTYAYIDTGVIGTDAIKVALIYKPAKVAPVGAYKTITSAVDPRFIDTRNRPSLAQTFQQLSSGQKLTVVVNHLKSKGSACTGDPDTGDGSGNCNGTRTAAAAALVDWLATDPTGSGDPDFLLIGDMNSYTFETPITTFEAGGFTNLLRQFHGLTPYSYVFNGESGYLDHALATGSLAGQVTGVTDWHINPDEPTVLDYNVEFKTANQVNTFYDPGPYRASDHDPVVIGFQFNSAPTADAGGPYTVAEGGSVTVAATGSDADGDALTYAWDLDNDGQFDDAAGQTASFSSAALDGPTIATIRVRVSDAGSSTIDDATVNVTNVAPTATFNAPASAVVGPAFTLSLTNANDAAPADIPGLQYAFDCGSGYGAFSASNTTSCPNSTTGTRNVGGKVRDDDGGVTEYRATVRVTSVPTADAGGPYTVAEGGSVTVTATGADQDGDALTYAWDLDNDGQFDDATGQTASFSAAAIDGPASRTIRVRVSDETSNVVDDATVNVTNVAPTATFNAPTSALAGSAFTLSLTNANDAAPADVPGLQYAFDCGSGYGAFSAANSTSCPTNSTGTRNVGGNVRDDDGGVTEYRAAVTVGVTYASLCALVQQYVDKEGVAKALCSKLDAAARKADRKDQEADLHAFVNQVEAQSGKSMTAEEAATLIRLAQAL